MSYIDEIFARLHIQHIREFLLHGVECVEISDKTYKQRIDETEKPMIRFIQDKFPDAVKCEEITEKVYDYGGACEEVYMEIGMQCGAVLATQILATKE